MPRPSPPSPPRKRLDHEQVLATAETLVDRDGWQHLTMTNLAAELGVKVPSLYNHVPNLEALRGELQVRTLRDLGAELRTVAMGKVEGNALRALATVFREFVRRHPSRYELAMREPHDRHAFNVASADASAAMAAVVSSYGIDQDDVMDLQLSVFAAIHGVVVLENAGFFGGFADVDHIHEMVLGLVLRLLDDHRSDHARSA